MLVLRVGVGAVAVAVRLRGCLVGVPGALVCREVCRDIWGFRVWPDLRELSVRLGGAGTVFFPFGVAGLPASFFAPALEYGEVLLFVP